MAVHVGFQGSWTDPATKRVDTQARWYTPGTGTFASRDMAKLPISGTAADNRYTYAADNPLTYNDPTGFMAHAAEVAAARPTPALSVEAQRQIAAMGADKFWAGVRAALAGVKPPPPVAPRAPAPPPQLSSAAQAQIKSMGEKNFWAGVSAYLAGARPPAPAPVRAAAPPPPLSSAAQAQIKSMGEKNFWAGVSAYLAGAKPPAPKPPAAKPPAPKPAVSPKKDCGFFGHKCIGDAAKALGRGVQSAGAAVAKNKLISACANFLPGQLGAGCGFAQAAGHLVNGEYAAAAMSAGGAALNLAGAGAGLKALGKLGTAGEDAAKALRTCHSFAPQTRVLLANGTTKPIGQIKIGDRVTATDPTTGRTALQPVTATMVHRDTDLLDLTIQTATGRSVIHTTEHHPFYNDTTHTWTDAANLHPGDRLHTNTSITATVIAAVILPASGNMYDLTINHTHTFYVQASETPVLVHNAGVGLCPVTGLDHGGLGEAATLNRLQSGGYRNIASEVRFMSSDGNIFRADFVAKNPSGVWVAVETKTNTGLISPNQAFGYPELTGSGVLVATSKLERFGIMNGDMMSVSKLEIDHWTCPSCVS